MHEVKIDHRTSIIKEKMKKIKNKIIVMSNKGGVGKSSISVMLALMLVRKGFKTAILDSDIHGPSIARMTGTEEINYTVNDDNTINPVEKSGLKIISIGGIVKETDKALIWRGPIKISIIRQLIADTVWGELDYLIIDLPPGTGDEPLSVCQEIKDITGAVIVTTPQKISKLDVSKAIDFINKMNIKIISMVENMSFMICPHCQKEIKLFTHSQLPENLKTIRMPFIREVNQLLDEGNFEKIFDNTPELEKTVESILF